MLVVINNYKFNSLTCTMVQLVHYYFKGVKGQH
jgi:hypothetical protein